MQISNRMYLCSFALLSWVVSINSKATDEGILQEMDRLLERIEGETRKTKTLVHSDDKRQLYIPCHDGYFSCGGRFGRRCLINARLCDGIHDCPNSYDELHCSTNTGNEDDNKVRRTFDKRGKYTDNCAEGFVSCGEVGTKCIRAEYLCDGIVDCYADGWDEKPQNCGQVNCPSGLIKCNGTGRCISRQDMCNDLNDCGDLEDESVSNCGTKRCGHSSTKCPGANLCVQNRFWCDGNTDCPGGEDELVHVCEEVPCDGVRCTDGRCIQSDKYCDGMPDCKDGDDEDVKKCGPVRCPRNTEQCGTANYCYSEPRWHTCDGHADCPNGADEADDNCPPEENDPGHWYSYKSKYGYDEKKLGALLSRILQEKTNI